MRNKAGGNLGSASGRSRFKQRREPYWVPIVRGCALGYRKGATGGTWIARARRADGSQQYTALGAADDLNDGMGLTYEAALAEARKRFTVAGSTTSTRYTVANALDNYMKHLRTENPESTVGDTEKRIESILKPALGDIELAKLRATDITRWRDSALKNEGGRKRKPTTVNRLMGMLKAALNYAWREDQIVSDDSPWRMVSILKGGGARKIFLTAAQSRALVLACKPSHFRNLVHAGLLTGARTGELVGLRCGDFDAERGTLEITDGKTGARTVTLSTEAVAFFEGIAVGRASRDLLLPREDGGPWNKNLHQRPFAAAVKGARLDKKTVFYSLRHTYISAALLAKVNIQVIAENVGTSVRMIEKHYGKFLQSDRRAMFDQMPALAIEEA